jgi:hypothetical protein
MRIQAVNDAGNLVFFTLLLAIAILSVTLAYRKLRRRQIRGLATATLVCLLAYSVVLLAVSLRSETRQLAPGTEKCFDDWCATVIATRSLISNQGRATKLVAVTLRIANHARKMAFRPSQPRVTLTLGDGNAAVRSDRGQREFERQAGVQTDLGRRLAAGDGFQTTLVFEVPAATKDASIVLLEGPAVLTRFLVGDENSFFHKKTVFPVTVD